MNLLDDVLTELPDGQVLDVCIGLHWIAVTAQVNGEKRCGLASTVSTRDHHAPESDVLLPGQLHTLSALELARMALNDHPLRTGIGLAAINALLPRRSDLWQDRNADEVIASLGAGKTVALIGSFPFVQSLRPRVGQLHVLELNPGPDEIPAEMASNILPQAEIVAITSMTLINHTLDGLLSLCQPETRILLLGPSTPLSLRLFEHGIDFLAGSIVTELDRVVAAVKQGASFRQIHRAGVRLVTLCRDGQLA